MYFNIQAKNRKINEKSEKSTKKTGNRSTSNGSTWSYNGRNVKNRVSLESSGVILLNLLQEKFWQPRMLLNGCKTGFLKLTRKLITKYNY